MDLKWKCAARLDDLEKPAQDAVNLCRELYRLTGRIESTAKRLKEVHPQLAAKVLTQIQEIDTQARKLSREVDEDLGID